MTKRARWLVICAAPVALAAVLASPGPAVAHQSPAGCSQNRLGVDIGPVTTPVLNGQPTCWHPFVFNNPFRLSDACLIDTTTVTLTCPAADGTSTGTVLTLGTNLSLPVDGSGDMDFGSVCCPAVTFNSGVDFVFARIDAGKQGDTTQGKFHQAVTDLSFQIFKEVTISVLSCSVEVDKEVSCVGAPFIDVGFTTNDGDGTSQSCDAWNAFPGMNAESVTVRYVARNTGTADLTSCSITESNTAITASPVSVPDIPTGMDTAPIDRTNDCSDTLAMGEPNRADLTCSCSAGGVTQMVTAFDRANFRCLTPGLNVDKVCTTVQGGQPSPFTITVSNTGTADLSGCVVDDKFSAPGDDMCAGSLTEATGFPTAPFDVVAGAPAHQIMGSLGPLGAGDTCNRASVQCNIVGSMKIISDSKDAICSVTTTTTTTTTSTTTTTLPTLPGGCRVTGGGTLDITNPRVVKATHGGQVGASVGIATAFTADSACIKGEWTHERHAPQSSGNFHGRSFDSLNCACLACAGDPDSGHVLDGLCNPGDRICGPEPRRAPDNAICFSGVGDFAPDGGGRSLRSVVFRVDVQDHSEPGGGTGPLPPDRYRIRIWFLSGDDPSSPAAIDLRKGVACAHAGVEDVTARSPDIDDGGDLATGNHQIHPQIRPACK